MLKFRHQRGFTLIEVVIVLAIAAIIFAVIFNAVSHGRRSEQDSKRKKLAIQVVAAFNTYASNNNGSYLGFACGSYCSSIVDPDNTSGQPVAGTVGAKATRTSGITYVTQAICGNGGSAGSAVNMPGNNFAVLYWSAITGSSICIDGSGANTVAGQAGGYGGGGGGSGGIYAVNGGSTSSCSPSASNCMNYPSGGTYTAWAPTQFKYNISGAPAGDRTLGVYYRNSTPLPSSYANFNINVYIDGVKVLANQPYPVRTDGTAPGPRMGQITIPASAQELAIEWTNDWCCGPSGEDANFVLNSLYIQ